MDPVPGPRNSRPGRPLSAASAWAILAELSGERPTWIHPAALSRLRRRMADADWVIIALQHGKPRAETVRWRVLPSDLSRIARSVTLVQTGLSAVSEDIDIVPARGELDAYVDSRILASIERQFRPAKEAEDPNLTLRVPEVPWVLGSNSKCNYLRRRPGRV